MQFLSDWLRSDEFFTAAISLATVLLTILVVGFWLRREE